MCQEGVNRKLFTSCQKLSRDLNNCFVKRSDWNHVNIIRHVINSHHLPSVWFLCKSTFHPALGSRSFQECVRRQDLMKRNSCLLLCLALFPLTLPVQTEAPPPDDSCCTSIVSEDIFQMMKRWCRSLLNERCQQYKPDPWPLREASGRKTVPCVIQFGSLSSEKQVQIRGYLCCWYLISAKKVEFFDLYVCRFISEIVENTYDPVSIKVEALATFSFHFGAWIFSPVCSD